jgi:hypothetical protein
VCIEEEADAVGARLPVYTGGEENRWGDDVRCPVGDVVEFASGDAGVKVVLYVRGPVLWGFVDIGGGTSTRVKGSIGLPLSLVVSLLVRPLVMMPFVDAIDPRSPFDVRGKPLWFIDGPGLFLPFSNAPCTPAYPDH